MIGDNVAKYRKNLNISQRELGRRSGLSGQMISKIENSNTIPSVTTLTKLADALETSVSELWGESETLNKEVDTEDFLNSITHLTGLKLDNIGLTDKERQIIHSSLSNALDLIRYSRLKND